MTAGYPTIEAVEAADQVQLTRWMRFLPSPDDESRPVLERIMERYHDGKRADPGGAVAASKAVGW